MAPQTRDFYLLVPEESEEGPVAHGICIGEGASQLRPQPPEEESFVAPGPNSRLHDPTLSALARQMSASVRDALPARPNPRAQIGFVLTHAGLLLVWDVVPTEEEWRDLYASGAGLESIAGKSDEELSAIFDLP